MTRAPATPRARAQDAATSAARFALEQGYRFRDEALLVTACTHRSLVPDGATPDYQRLEFLGDAVLGLIVADALFRRHPAADEGGLSRREAAIVSTESLAAASARAGLVGYLRVSAGARADGVLARASVLADIFEAIAAAIYLDGGLDAARTWVNRHLEAAFDGGITPARDPKSALQELLQARDGSRPSYRVDEVRGPDHAQTFHATALVDGRPVGGGAGASRKEAEKAAAAAALRALTPETVGTK